MGPLTVPDYVAMAATSCAFMAGLVIGFSGALAFLAGLVSAAVFCLFAWPPLSELLAEFIPNAIGRGAVAFAISILVFGIVRWIVAKCVHGLVAQPGDSLLGALFSAVAGFVVSLGVIWALESFFPGDPTFDSELLEKVLSYASAKR